MDSLEIVRRLAAKGADLNARASGRRKETVMTHLNLNGGTPFFFAARTGDTELMRLLVDLGADPKLPNEDGATPATWNRKNESGWTPLRIAAGVYRAQNFRFDVPTTKAIQDVMAAAGLPTDIEAGSTVTAALPAR